MISVGHENGFFTKADGSFFAFVDVDLTLGTALLKATPRGDTKVYPFIAQASSPDVDFEGEVILQKGLNFGPFMADGCYNWNHLRDFITGYPSKRKAWFEGGVWRCDGDIISGMPLPMGYNTDMMVTQHNQLAKSGAKRGLCVSLEGKVTDRSDCGRYVRSADIYNIAHTFKPVNPNCSVSMLAKSFHGMAELKQRDLYYDEMHKSLSLSAVSPFTKQDLEGAAANEDERDLDKKLIGHLLQKGYGELEAKRHVYDFLWRKSTGLL